MRMGRLGIGSKKLKMNEESLARDDTVLGPRYWVGLAARSGGCGDYAGRSLETEPPDRPGRPIDRSNGWCFFRRCGTMRSQRIGLAETRFSVWRCINMA